MRWSSILEGLLVVALGVALIAKPEPRVTASAMPAPAQPASVVAPVRSSPAVTTGPLIRTFTGERRSVGGNGTARTFVRFRNGRPEAVGVILSSEALRAAPRDAGEAIVLPLPDGYVVPPFAHVAVDWNRTDAAGGVVIRFHGGKSVEPVAVTIGPTPVMRFESVSAPAGWVGYVPTTYSVRRDASMGDCVVALENLLAR